MTETMHDVGSLYAGVGISGRSKAEKHLVLLDGERVSAAEHGQRGEHSPRGQRRPRRARRHPDWRHDSADPPPRFVPGGGIQMSVIPTTNQAFDQSFRMQTLRCWPTLPAGSSTPTRAATPHFARWQRRRRSAISLATRRPIRH